MRAWKSVVTGAAVLVTIAIAAPAANAAAPVATTLAATNITSTSAVLHGTVNNSTPGQPYAVPPYAFPTTYTFVYGETTQYGSQTTSQSLPASTSTQTVSATITGLKPGTTYHFRLIAINSQGEVGTGGDVTFTTLPTPARKRPKLLLRSIPARDRTAPFKYGFTGRISLPTGVARSSTSCSGHVVIRVRRGHRSVKVGTAKVSRHCTFHKRLTIPTSRLASSGHGRLSVLGTFRGNTVLLPARKTIHIRYG
jgi:hypothetical protein